MKMLKITEDLYLNSYFIKYIEADGEESTLVTVISGGTFSLDLPIKKVLDAISGSEEHSIEYEDAENYKCRKMIKKNILIKAISGKYNREFQK